MAFVIFRVHQEIKRNLEDVRHLGRIKYQLEARCHHPHHGRDVKSGAGFKTRQMSYNINIGSAKSDFLFCLAQCRRFGRSVAGFQLAAWKRDLPGMGLQVIGAPCQKHIGAMFQTLDDRDENRGRAMCGRGHGGHGGWRFHRSEPVTRAAAKFIG